MRKKLVAHIVEHVKLATGRQSPAYPPLGETHERDQKKESSPERHCKPFPEKIPDAHAQRQPDPDTATASSHQPALGNNNASEVRSDDGPRSLEDRIGDLERWRRGTLIVSTVIAAVSAVAIVASAIIQWQRLIITEPRFEYETASGELYIRQIGGIRRVSERVDLEHVLCDGTPKPVGDIWFVGKTQVSGSVKNYITSNLHATIGDICPQDTEDQHLVFVHNNRTLRIRLPNGIGTIIDPIRHT